MATIDPRARVREIAAMSDGERSTLIDRLEQQLEELRQELRQLLAEGLPPPRPSLSLVTDNEGGVMATARIIGDREILDLCEFLEEQPDAQAIVYLLTLHKLAENQASGRLRDLLAADAAALFHVLWRFAPEAMGDALAIWEEQTGEKMLPGGDDA